MGVTKGRVMHRGITQKVMGLLEADPKALWTWQDLRVESPEYDEKAAQNCFHRLYTIGKIKRHIEKDPETNLYRYALEISSAKSDQWVKNDATSAPKTKTGKRKKGQLPSSREVRTMFAQTLNQIAKLEDMMITIVDQHEENEKLLNKIKIITG